MTKTAQDRAKAWTSSSPRTRTSSESWPADPPTQLKYIGLVLDHSRIPPLLRSQAPSDLDARITTPTRLTRLYVHCAQHPTTCPTFHHDRPPTLQSAPSSANTRATSPPPHRTPVLHHPTSSPPSKSLSNMKPTQQPVSPKRRRRSVCNDMAPTNSREEMGSVGYGSSFHK